MTAPTLVTVEQELQAAIKIGKALGLSSGIAIDQACGAVLEYTGVDLKKLFRLQENSGVAVKPCYGPGELAALVGPGFDSRKINKILTEIGFQVEILKSPLRCSRTGKKRVAGYEITDLGMDHVVTGTNGRLRVKSFKWRDTVLQHIKAAIA